MEKLKSLLNNKKNKVLLISIIVIIVNFLILSFVIKLWRLDFSKPIIYFSDATFMNTIFKALIDNGWYLTNKFTGAPFGTVLFDYPMTDFFHWFIIKILSLFTNNWVTIVNIFALHSFIVLPLVCLFVARQLKLSWATGIALGILYSFIPYHIARLFPGHIFLTVYYIIPLIVLIIMWLFKGEVIFFYKKDTGKYKILWNKKNILILAITILTATSGIYYAFFSVFFIGVAGLVNFLNEKNKTIIISVSIILSVLFFTLFLQLLPTYYYTHKHGKNNVVAKRDLTNVEFYSLNISRLVLPISKHRINLLSKIRSKYKSIIPGEGSETIGLIGTIGFLYLLLLLFMNKFKNEYLLEELKCLSKLNIAALLFATIGGFSSIFAILISPQIRAYNRISIFIAFFSVLAFLIILERIQLLYCNTLNKKRLFYSFFIFLIIFGIYDQSTVDLILPYKNIKNLYLNDKNFIKKIEASVPEGSSIYQMPHMPFPEHPPIVRMPDYSHFRAYLHSKKLKWSYGVIKGRDPDSKMNKLNAKPLDEKLKILYKLNFAGIFINRHGFKDNAISLEKKLKSILNIEPLISDNKELSFYSFKNFRVKSKDIDDNVKKFLKYFSTKGTDIIKISWEKGFYGLERAKNNTWRWCNSKGRMVIYNNSKSSKKTTISFKIYSGYHTFSDLTINSKLFSDSLKINNSGYLFTKTINIPARSKIPIIFLSKAKRVNSGADRRKLYFNVQNFKVVEKN